MNTTQWAALYVLAVIALAIVWLNVWYYQFRTGMTPTQKKEDDEESKAELRLW